MIPAMVIPQDGTIEIRQGDCLRIPLPDDAADLVFTSPPYENVRSYGMDFSYRGEDWVKWAIPRVHECLRVCRGAVVWVVNGRSRKFRWSCTPMLLVADLHRSGVICRKPLIYQRIGVPGSGGPDWFKDCYEFCLVFQKRRGRLPWSDNTACGHPPKNKTSRVITAHGRHRRVRQSYDPPKIANPGNVIDTTDTKGTELSDVVNCGVAGGGHSGSWLAHMNEASFPEKLVDFFVRSLCPPGGLVADPMCGSGTVGAVAIRLKRRVFLMDIRESQVALTRLRIQETLTGRRITKWDIRQPDALNAIEKMFSSDDSCGLFAQHASPDGDGQAPQAQT